ncbi:hypothetical protein JW935_25910 [candidate division KSB1 bacterium]|nr:hypothetical protein [candidate division KSB1 bacterium]
MNTQIARASQRTWKVIYWALMAAFLLAATLNMLRVRAGVLTSYLADLTVPALLYVISRGLARGKPSSRHHLMRWIGRTPRRAAAVFFLASAATEVSQILWPRGLFAGRFDPWDIVAYGVGLLICYSLDNAPEGQAPVAEAVQADVQRKELHQTSRK